VHERQRNARVFRPANKFSTSEQPAREFQRGLFHAFVETDENLGTDGKKMGGKKIKQGVACDLNSASSSSCQSFSCHQIVTRSIGYNHI
jgi:hypothetical protein